MSAARFGCLAVVELRPGVDGGPGLALEDLCGASVLARTVARVRAATLVDETVVLVPESAGAAAVLAHLPDGTVGRLDSGGDVLDACLALALEHGARHVVSVRSDHPCVDPDRVDFELGALRAFDADLVSHGEDAAGAGVVLARTVRSVRALRWAQAGADAGERAELGQRFLARHARSLRVVELEPDAAGARAAACLALTTVEELSFVRRVWGAIDHEGDGSFPLGRALRWVEAQAVGAQG